jgi:hypothetical protein
MQKIIKIYHKKGIVSHLFKIQITLIINRKITKNLIYLNKV